MALNSCRIPAISCHLSSSTQSNFLPKSQIIFFSSPTLNKTQKFRHSFSAMEAGSGDYASISNEEWKKRLTNEQFYVTRKKGTERPFTGRRKKEILETTIRRRRRRRPASSGISAALPPLDLTEDNVRQVLADARTVFAQIFDPSIGITGEAEFCELDGPFVKISLRGRFWHERSLVLARLGNYLKQRIPEILEVDIEDEKQLDDSPENF